MTKGPRTASAAWTRLARAFSGALVVTALLSGCVTQQGGTTGKLGRAAEDVQSAVTSAELGLNQDRDRLTLPGATDTLLEDMLDEVHQAAQKMGKLTPETAGDLDRQDRALDLAGKAERALAVARGNLELSGAGGSATPADIRNLADMADMIGRETQGWTP